jgi:hypothetical protein
MDDPFILQSESTARCPGCNRLTEMLVRESVPVHSPIFYVCWPCRRIWQAGVAEVKREESSGKTVKSSNGDRDKTDAAKNHESGKSPNNPTRSARIAGRPSGVVG